MDPRSFIYAYVPAMLAPRICQPVHPFLERLQLQAKLAYNKEIVGSGIMLMFFRTPTGFKSLCQRIIQLIFISCVMGGLGQLSLPAWSDPPTSIKATVTVQINHKPYHLAVAKTEAEQEKGLMFQPFLPKRTGMLFPIQPSRRVAFWMKNTLIPLDMLFIQNNQIVQIVHIATPCTQAPCTIYASDQSVDSVIELPGNTAKKEGINVGSLLSW